MVGGWQMTWGPWSCWGTMTSDCRTHSSGSICKNNLLWNPVRNPQIPTLPTEEAEEEGIYLKSQSGCFFSPLAQCFFSTHWDIRSPFSLEPGKTQGSLEEWPCWGQCRKESVLCSCSYTPIPLSVHQWGRWVHVSVQTCRGLLKMQSWSISWAQAP